MPQVSQRSLATSSMFIFSTLLHCLIGSADVNLLVSGCIDITTASIRVFQESTTDQLDFTTLRRSLDFLHCVMSGRWRLPFAYWNMVRKQHPSYQVWILILLFGPLQHSSSNCWLVIPGWCQHAVELHHTTQITGFHHFSYYMTPWLSALNQSLAADRICPALSALQIPTYHSKNN